MRVGEGGEGLREEGEEVGGEVGGGEVGVWGWVVGGHAFGRGFVVGRFKRGRRGGLEGSGGAY